MRRAVLTRATGGGEWSRSTFDRGREGVEWRVDGGNVSLRHARHPEDGTWTLSLAEWQAFVAAAQAGEAGSVGY